MNPRPIPPLLLLLAAAVPAHADRPLWELGIGLAALSAPDYRGADERSAYFAPYPHLVYRGEFLRIDKNQISGELFESERVRLDLSVAGAPPVDSDRNGARDGMASIDPALELGPSLEWRFAGDTRTGGYLKLPLRKVVALDLGALATGDAGWTFSPYLEYEDNAFGPAGRWSLGLSAGPIFADARYHDTYYGVDAADVRADRPRYRGRAGYSGSRITLTLDAHRDRLWWGLLLRYDHLGGATIESSPLVRRRDGLTAVAALSWFFWRSDATVPEGR